jgi:hypothetical protein
MLQGRDSFNPIEWCEDIDRAIWKGIAEIFNNEHVKTRVRRIKCNVI